MRRTFFRWARMALVWTVAVLLFLDTASACRFRRRRSCGGYQSAATCGTDAKAGGMAPPGGGDGVEAPPPPAPAAPAAPVAPQAETPPPAPSPAPAPAPAVIKPAPAPA